MIKTRYQTTWPATGAVSLVLAQNAEELDIT